MDCSKITQALTWEYLWTFHISSTSGIGYWDYLLCSPYSIFHLLPYTSIFHLLPLFYVLFQISHYISVLSPWPKNGSVQPICRRLACGCRPGRAWLEDCMHHQGEAAEVDNFTMFFLVYKVKIDMDWYGLMWVNHHVLIIYVFHSFSRAMFNSQRYRCFMICNTK